MISTDIFKTLANDTRLQILEWLKEPEKHFPDQKTDHPVDVGICVGLIQQKAGLSQSTISHYLSMMQKAKLITSTRIGQWTYYKRNNETIGALAKAMATEL